MIIVLKDWREGTRTRVTLDYELSEGFEIRVRDAPMICIVIFFAVVVCGAGEFGNGWYVE